MQGCGEIYVRFICPTPTKERLNSEQSSRCRTQLESDENFEDVGMAFFYIRHPKRFQRLAPGEDALISADRIVRVHSCTRHNKEISKSPLPKMLICIQSYIQGQTGFVAAAASDMVLLCNQIVLAVQDDQSTTVIFMLSSVPSVLCIDLDMICHGEGTIYVVLSLLWCHHAQRIYACVHAYVPTGLASQRPITGRDFLEVLDLFQNIRQAKIVYRNFLVYENDATVFFF